MPQFADRVAIVTGAAQGIGLAVASRLFADGARVLMADIQVDKVTEAARRLDPAGLSVAACAVDVSCADSTKAMVDIAGRRFGRLDILANVAGGSGRQIIEQIEDMTDAIWDSVIANNLRGTFLCSRAAVAQMRRSGRGAIINFATGSIRGFTGKSTSAARLAYVAAKAGIIGFTNQLAQDLRGAGIAVNVIQPGFVLTEPGARVREMFDAMPAADQRAMLRGRMPRKPEEIAWAVAFIASHRADELTGTSIRLSGPIESSDLRLVREPDGPLASTALIEAR
jgi:NAD(P)-dependent dehydrogenase (short-subunit alcohol dehydrogenase family)